MSVIPQISVVMPVRDGARWLGDAIASIIGQTFGDFELLVIDDGSSDDSRRIAEEWAHGDSRIRVLHLDRSGLVAALNLGLSESRGRLIARLDADDIAHPDRLARQSGYLELHPEIALLGSWARRIDEHGAPQGIVQPETRPDRLTRLLTEGKNPFLHSSMMIRSVTLQKIGGYRPAFEGAEDYDLWLRIAEVAQIANLAQCLIQYRSHPTSVTQRLPVRQLFSVRLAQAAASLRRNGAKDPTAGLTTPPDWNVSTTDNASMPEEVLRLFRLLDLANMSKAVVVDIAAVDMSALSDRRHPLTHAERRVAQTALLNLLSRKSALPISKRASLLFHFIRLHPTRAAKLAQDRLRQLSQ